MNDLEKFRKQLQAIITDRYDDCLDDCCENGFTKYRWKFNNLVVVKVT